MSAWLLAVHVREAPPTMAALRSSSIAGTSRGLVSPGNGTSSRVGRLTDPACQRGFPASTVTVSSRHPQESTIRLRSPPLAAVAPDVQVGMQLDRSPPLLSAKNMEKLLEKIIYNCRFFALLGVSGSLVGSVLCFLKGCAYVSTAFGEYFLTGGKVIPILIGAIDMYLIGTVMLVFGMGLYALFITNVDIAKISSHQRSNFLGMFMLQERPKCLEIKTVNELKTKLGHVIVMALLIGLFDKVQKVGIGTPWDLLCFTASLLLSSCGLFLLSKLAHSKHK